MKLPLNDGMLLCENAFRNKVPTSAERDRAKDKSHTQKERETVPEIAISPVRHSASVEANVSGTRVQSWGGGEAMQL